MIDIIDNRNKKDMTMKDMVKLKIYQIVEEVRDHGSVNYNGHIVVRLDCDYSFIVLDLTDMSSYWDLTSYTNTIKVKPINAKLTLTIED